LSTTAIRVRNLGKQYQLGTRERGYTTFRDAITNAVKAPFERFRSLSGRATPAESFWALQGVSFDVKEGEVIGIIGRNGAGKSTLLKILSQITEPTSGEIELHGRVGSLLEVGTGFHPELSGRENIYLNGAILGMKREEITRRFDEIVAFSEVEKFLDTPVKRYSSGMYTRLAFSVAAHLEPDILIVDEVLSVGDLRFQKKCLGKMNELSHSKGRTVLFVTHNMALVQSLCDKAIYLMDGRIHDQGPTKKILSAYMSNESNSDPESGQTQLPLTVADLTLIDFFACDESLKPVQSFRTSSPICFAVRYELHLATPGLRIGLDLVSSTSGEVLFRTFDDDLKTQTRNLGNGLALCRIPGDLLKPETYFARLMVGVHNVKWIVMGEIHQQIQVEHLDGVNSAYGDKRPGIIMPAIPWRNVS